MKWIKVQDKLPDTDRWVWICVNGKTQTLPAWYRKGKWFSYDQPLAVVSVSHWMEYPDKPLPE